MSCLDEFNPTTHAAVVLTLSHLRRLLDMALAHAENPALDRCERTVEGVARAYLPHSLSLTLTDGERAGCMPMETVMWWCASEKKKAWHLDLTDPGTVKMLPVMLALALGLDPGVMGLGCLWARGRGAWWLHIDACGEGVYWSHSEIVWTDWPQMQRIYAPTVAAESDPVRALCLAVLHVLGTS